MSSYSPRPASLSTLCRAELAACSRVGPAFGEQSSASGHGV